MMMLTGLLLLAQASTAMAPASTPAEAAAPPAAEQKLICHSETIGASRIPQRICRTKSEWDQIERQAEEDYKYNVNRNFNTGNSPK
jgi:predicted secreted protein